MKKLFYTLFALFLTGTSLFAQTQDPSEPDNTNKNDSITVEVFEINNGWGYDIYVNGKKYIHQENIPAVSGIKYFKSESDAIKAGELVKSKIKRKIMPPTITVNELDSLGIINKTSN